MTHNVTGCGALVDSQRLHLFECLYIFYYKSDYQIQMIFLHVVFFIMSSKYKKTTRNWKYHLSAYYKKKRKVKRVNTV